MKKIIFSLATILLISCNSTDKKFLITNNNVGLLPKGLLVSKLDSVFSKDSLVKTAFEGEFRYASDERIMVFEKSGEKKQLLEITPSLPEGNNPQVVQDIQIMDERFATEKGISLKSTFADIKKVYKEFDIEASLMSIIVSPKESSLYFVFDKSELTASSTGEYTIEDIPDTATIKRLMITWVK